MFLCSYVCAMFYKAQEVSENLDKSRREYKSNTMSDTFKFWNHGVTVVPEYTKAYTNTNNELYMRPAGFGTIIRQRRGTWNWFHIPIPTPTRLDDDASTTYHAWLRADINDYAVIQQVTIHEAIAGNSSPRIYSTNVNYTGRAETFSFNVPNNRATGPLTMSIRVRFDTDNGQVIFRGAGAHFEEAT